MHKFLTVAVCFVAAVLGAADIDFGKVHSLFVEAARNRATLDQSIPAKIKAYADSTQPTNDDGKLRKIQLLAIARLQTTGADRSFEAHKKFVDDQIAAAKLTKAPGSVVYLSILYFWWESDFCKPIYELAKTLPGHERWSDMGHVCEGLGKFEEAYDYYMAYYPGRSVRIAVQRLNDPVKAFEAAKMINGNKQFSAQIVGSVISYVASGLCGNAAISDAQMKAFLTTANRKYSAMMIKDEEAWTPVIKAIRTLLQTY